MQEIYVATIILGWKQGVVCSCYPEPFPNIGIDFDRLIHNNHPDQGTQHHPDCLDLLNLVTLFHLIIKDVTLDISSKLLSFPFIKIFNTKIIS